MARVYCASFAAVVLAGNPGLIASLLIFPQVQPPMLPTHLFLVDVSYAAISSGATAAACNAIQHTLDDLPGTHRFCSCEHVVGVQTCPISPWDIISTDSVWRSVSPVIDLVVSRASVLGTALSMLGLLAPSVHCQVDWMSSDPLIWSRAGGDRARLGIATFDSAVQFYALRPGQSAPQMLVVPDTAEPYAPAAGSLLVNARKARDLVCALHLMVSWSRTFRGQVREYNGPVCAGRREPAHERPESARPGARDLASACFLNVAFVDGTHYGTLEHSEHLRAICRQPLVSARRLCDLLSHSARVQSACQMRWSRMQAAGC